MQLASVAVLLGFVACLAWSGFPFAHGDGGHHHGNHGNMYSREVNEDAHTHDCGHDHDHTHGAELHDHTHNTEVHDHTHGAELHDHTHGAELHDHTHGAELHDHTHSTEVHDHTHGAELHDHTHNTEVHDHTHGAEIHDHTHNTEVHDHTHGAEIHDHTHNCGHDHSFNYDNVKRTPAELKLLDVWFKALGCTVLISIVPALLLNFIPVEKNPSLMKVNSSVKA